MKRRSLIFAGFFLLLFIDSAFCQLLFRENLEEENYGRTGYNKYGRSVVNRMANPKYDSFGNYLMDGVRAIEWTEEKINSKHMIPAEAYSVLEKSNPKDDGEYFREYLNNLVVVSESQKNFSTRFIFGNEIRVKFSPLTLDMAVLNGLRWDFNFLNDYNLTLVSSRADLPIYFGREYITTAVKYRLFPVYLTGAHFERKLGIFNIAANYVNTYKSDSSQSRQKNSITGTIPYNGQVERKTRMLVVKLEDGSRFDGNGPRIFELYPVFDGEPRLECLVGISKGSWEGDYTAVRNLVDNPNLHLYQNRYFIDPKRVPDYKVFERAKIGATPRFHIMPIRDMTDPIIKHLGDITGDSKKYLEVNGGEYLQFWFRMPDDIEVTDVEFRSLVGNDYKFSISELYHNDFGGPGGQDPTYFYTVKESKGHITDMSNCQWVRFQYGQQTANMLMGFRIDSNVKDFRFVAEIVKNLQFYQFMHNDAKKFRRDAEAYYINVQKDFGKFSFGTEYFKIDPGYSTSFDNIDPAYRHMYAHPTFAWGPYLNDDTTLTGGADAPKGAISTIEYMNNTMEINTVDDNDDKDRFPDYHIYKKLRDRNGIFPGRDRNGNNRPDTNENDNLIPDYAEPFFLYYVEPDEYDYGDDLNNNGVIDDYEDDDKPDYPYDRDTKGYHVFTSYGENVGMKYTLGYINFEQINSGGKTNIRYGKFHYNRFIPFFADLTVASTFKKVEDTIQDYVFRHERRLSTTLVDSFTYRDNPFMSREGIQHEKFFDPLRYRDSYVSTSYFNTKLFHIPNLTINIILKYDLNHQNKTSFQPKNDIIERAQVYKAEYNYYFHRFRLTPQIKFMSRKLTNHDGFERTFHEEYFYPIIKLEYPLTFRTMFRAGVQGFPGLNCTVRNLTNNQLDYDERHYLIMLSNRSLYQGYDLSLNFGYEIHWQDLKGIMREAFSRTDRVLFVRLIVGKEPIT